MTTTTDAPAVANVTCTCRPPGGSALCFATATFAGSDYIDALTNARLAGWGVRADGGAARCPGCAAAGVPFARAGGKKPGRSSVC